MSVVVSPWTKGSSKTWRVRVKLTTPSGHRIEASKKSPFESKTASRAWGLELEKQLWSEALTPKPPPAAPTIAEFALRFLDYLRSRRRAPATISAYEVALRLHIVPVIGTVRLDQLTPVDHEKLLNALTKLKPSSASEVVKTFNRLLTIAVTLKVVQGQPSRCSSISRDPPSVRAYTSDEVARLLAACPQLRDRVIVYLGTHGGMRRSEIAALRREDFSPTCDAVTIARHVWRREVLEGAKHGKVRTVRLGSTAAAMMRTYLAELVGPWLFPSKPPARRRGAPIPKWVSGCTTCEGVAIRLERACGRAGVEYLGCHHLRRTGATAAARSGASPAALAAFLGHSDLRMAQRYIALQGDDGERIADALDGFGAGGV